MSVLVSESPMKIHVNRVPFEGLHETARYEPQALDVDRPDIHTSQPFTVSAFISKAGDELVVEADILGQVDVACGRCLSAFVMPLQTTATLTYHVGPTDVVDMTEDVRQEILLAYPMILLCTPDCKGLCRRCGKNLNEQRCAC